jgi:hypothetical protein
MIKFLRDSESKPEFYANDSWGQKYNSLFFSLITLNDYSTPVALFLILIHDDCGYNKDDYRCFNKITFEMRLAEL